ncbi:unnamed protein product [Periconia digitata]|uniref:Uncharacterized protein n=1 Tax=Periconia digitata TaxID=1303443 RepID=A0A9W4UNU2_9PLEO|nr:unnamed protein product [Periconia digitata]
MFHGEAKRFFLRQGRSYESDKAEQVLDAEWCPVSKNRDSRLLQDVR